MYNTITALSKTKYLRKHRFDMYVAFEDCDFLGEVWLFWTFSEQEIFLEGSPRSRTYASSLFYIWVVILVGVVWVAGIVFHETALVL